MKQIIGFDFDGTVLKNDSKVHEDWFRVMGYLLKKPSTKKLAGKKDYFPEVFKVMEQYTGLNKEDKHDRKIMTALARNLFQMLYLRRIKVAGKDAFYDELIDVLVNHKQKYTLALITTAPADAVAPALKIGGIFDLFDIISITPIEKRPNKKELLETFCKKHGKPIIYIGNSLEDGKACKDLEIPFALAKWDKYDKEAEKYSKYKMSKPSEVTGAIKLET